MREGRAEYFGFLLTGEPPWRAVTVTQSQGLCSLHNKRSVIETILGALEYAEK